MNGISRLSVRGGGEHDFLQIFVSHGTENFVGETFSVSLFSGIEKIYSQEGYVTILFRKVSVSITENFFRGTILCFRKF